MARIGSYFALCSLILLAGAGAPLPAAADPEFDPRSDGFLSRKVEVIVYPRDASFATSPRGWTLAREISLFEGYLWRHSLRRLSVEARLTIIPRGLGAEEFRNYGEKFGFLLDRSPKVEEDLGRIDRPARDLLLLYDPPADRPSRLAGRTFFEGNHASIPLRPPYFEQDGFRRPLHLVMAHEYLHLLDIAFSRIRHPAGFLDPDGVARSDYPDCIEEGGDLSMRSLLRYDRSCRPIDWTLLSPESGLWVPR